MFFSQDILQKRGGKFGVIWIAATKPIQLTRRDYSSVNVAKSCDDIINYITLRGPPIKPGGARPRFSLYLSSQLMYGVVRVYNKQQHYLMSDTTTLCGRFRSLASTCEIDLKGLMRLDAVSMPDISKDSAPRGAHFNPEFGVFRYEDIVAPDEIPDIEIWKLPQSPVVGEGKSRESTLEGSDISLSPSPKVQPRSFAPELGSPLQADPHKITMLDVPLSPIIPVEEVLIPGEKDLPPLEEEFRLETEQEMEKTAEMTRARLLTDVETGLQLSPGAPTIETTLESDVMDIDKGVLPPMEETPAVMPELWEVPPSPQRKDGPADPLADVTPFSPPADREISKLSKREQLALQLSPVQPSPAGRKRKRQLRFADEEMQIPKVKIRSNMMAGQETCRSFELAAAEPARAVDLLSRPSRKDFSHRRLLPLWKRNCRTRHADETDSERAMPVWTVPDLRLETSSDSAGMQSPPAMPLMDITLSPLPEREEPKDGEEILACGPEMVVDLIPSIATETDPRGPLPRGRDISEMSVERARELSSVMERSRLLDVSSLHERLSRDRISGEAPSLSRSREASYLSSDSLTLRKGPSLSPERRSREPKVSTAEISLMDDLLEVSEEREVMGAEIQPLSPIAATLGVPTTEPLLRSPSHQQLLRSISTHTAREEWTTFSQLCPRFQTTRPQAAKTFSHLLDLLKQQALVAKQDEAYGEIFIGRQRGG